MSDSTGYEPLYTLKAVASNLWVVDGGWIRLYGLPYPTRMTIIRLPCGSIWVHSPVEDKNGLADSVAKLGPIKHLVAPNWLHYYWLSDWQARFPKALSWGCPGVSERALRKGTTLHLDYTLSDRAPDDWASAIDQCFFDLRYLREIVFYHRSSETLILTDLIMNFEISKMPLWTRPILKLAKIADPDPLVSRGISSTYDDRRKYVRKLIERLFEWSPKRVILSHGRWFEADGGERLRYALRDMI